MSERIMKVLANCDQGLQESEKLRARTNIGALGGVRVTDSSGTTDLVPDSQGRVTVDLTDAGKVQSDWDETNPNEDSYIKNKPTIPAAPVQSDWDENDDTKLSYIKNKPELAAVATSGDYDDLTNKPTIPAAQVQSDWSQSDNTQVDYIKNKPSLATVATSGSYTDLTNKPTIPEDKVYLFQDYAFNRTELRAAIASHKVIQMWKGNPQNLQLRFTRYEEVTVNGDLCEIYHFSTVYAGYVTPFATDWRLGDAQIVYNTVSLTHTIEFDTKLFDHEVPDPSSGDVGKVLTAGYDAQDARGTWSWQTIQTGETYTAGDGIGIDANNEISVKVDGSTITFNSDGELTVESAPQVQSDWAQTSTTAVDYIKNKPTTTPLIAGTNITINYTAQGVSVATDATRVVTRSAPYYQDSVLTGMSISNPGQNYGATIKDGSGNTLGFYVPLHGGATDAGKVLRLQESNGSYYVVWGVGNMGMADLKPLTLESVTVSTSQYTLMVEDGKAYRFTMSTSGYVGINTTSEETVHTVLSFRNDGTGCNTANITWKDETLGQHDIQIDLYGQPQGVEYMFDVYVRRVRISDVNYCIARVYDYPVAWRRGMSYSTDADANGLIGLYN